MGDAQFMIHIWHNNLASTVNCSAQTCVATSGLGPNSNSLLANDAAVL